MIDKNESQVIDLNWGYLETRMNLTNTTLQHHLSTQQQIQSSIRQHHRITRVDTQELVTVTNQKVQSASSKLDNQLRETIS